ncbi:MAG: hypothetical protein LBV47_09580, partial [Bacteroidales bacterium]|nr:hypothetical protein [Bacteroidales bacterium]
MIDFKSESVKNLLLAAIASKGYKEDAKKTSKRHRVFKDDSNDTIVVSASAHFQLYYNPGISDDKGDVISFLLNRAGIGVNCRNHLSAHFKQIEGELEKLGAYNFSREFLPIERKPFNWSEHKPFVSNFTENVPGNILALLENRFINPAVLFDPDLQPVQQYKNNKTGYSNIFFPFLDINGYVVGGQFKYLLQNEHGYQTVKMNLPDSERERSLWHTNGTGKKCLFIVEDPFDAIAFKL